MICPECQSEATRIIESKRHQSGTIRRRFRCRACGHRWTRYEGEPPGHRGGWPAGRQQVSWRRLTEEQIRLVLTSPLSAAEIGATIGRSRWAVSMIRSGQTYANVCLDLPRRMAELSCWDCQHWERGRCGMGFPDPDQEGPGFAAECSLYEENT